MGSSDMTTTFAAQSQAHARQAKEDTTNQIILEEMLTGMSNVPESLLLHPVLSGALLRDFVPRCANYLTTSFDDMCEREILFITVLRFVTKLTSYGTDYQHLMEVPPDEVTGTQEDDDTAPPPSIAELLRNLSSQASVFAAALGSRNNSNEAKVCMRLSTAIDQCGIMVSNSGVKKKRGRKKKSEQLELEI